MEDPKEQLRVKHYRESKIEEELKGRQDGSSGGNDEVGDDYVV